MDHLNQIPGIGQQDEPMLEAWSALAALARETKKVRLSTLVTGVTYRNPALLAKTATTLDVISGGRAVFGIGAAWFEAEHDAFGFDFPPIKERMDRLDEALAIAKAMFTQDRPTFEGRHYQVTNILNIPKPIQAGGPPILIGGGGEQRTLKIAAKYADMTHWFPLGREALRHKKDVLARHCEAIGRDPGTIELTMATPVVVTRNDAERDALLARIPEDRRPHVIAGGIEACADGLQPVHRRRVHGVHLQQPAVPDARADRARRRAPQAPRRPRACVRPFRFLAEPGDVADGKALIEAAHRAESIGYDVMVYPDHVVLPFGLVPLLTTVAAVTERLRVSAFVVNNDLRHPALVAQDMASIDVISGGRVEVAIGGGWNVPEYEALGIPFEPIGRRIDRLTEAVAVIKGCFAEGPFSFAGEHYTITNHEGLPKPVQKPRPPLFIGGGGKRLLTLAGREADIVGVAPRTLASASSQGGRAFRSSVDHGGRDGGEARLDPRGGGRPLRRPRDQHLPVRDVADPHGPRAEGRRRRAGRDPQPDRDRDLAGRVPRVAARVHRVRGRAGGEAPGAARAARHQLDHGRRPRHARPGRRAAGGNVGCRARHACLQDVADVPDRRSATMLGLAGRSDAIAARRAGRPTRYRPRP